MIIAIEERWELTSRFKRKGKRSIVALVACDVCDKRYELPASYAQTLRFHICSALCNSVARSRGGILYERIIATNVVRYGAKFASQSELGKQKQRTTNVQRYGVKATSQHPDVERKRRQTCVERYGGPAATSDPMVIAKVQATNEIKFGGGVLLDDDVRRRYNDTMTTRYGAPWAAQCTDIRGKQQETNLLRHGYVNPFLSPAAKARAQSPATRLKSHETMKRNGTYGKPSRAEETCYVLLCDLFGESDVERQAWVNRWPIDFYVKSIDAYVQEDGIYWHGLDRPIELIAEHRTKRDVVIHQKWATDREQDAWFAEKHMKLVRITDHELATHPGTLNERLSRL